MLWTEKIFAMWKFLRKTALYVFAIPVLVMYLGMASNQLVIRANHGTFPVQMNEERFKEWVSPDPDEVSEPNVLSDGTVMIDEVHCLMTEKTHLNFLADIFDLHDRILSVGDLLIDLGFFGNNVAPYIWGMILYFRKNE